MIQKRENRELPGSCISKCHLRLDFVIWSREARYCSTICQAYSRHATCTVDRTTWRKHRAMALSQTSKVK